MTFETQIQANYGTALADLRDKVSGLTNWSVKHDSTGGATALTKGDYFVLTTSTPNEDLYIGVESNLGGLVLQHGADYDSGTELWNDRYGYDPSTVGKNYSTYSYQNDNDVNPAEHFAAYPMKSPSSNDPATMTDPGSYWIEYVDGKGFGFWWQREVADGKDAEIFVGLAKLNRAWDYTGADAREAAWCLGFGDSSNGLTPVWMSESGSTNSDPDFNGDIPESHRFGNNDYPARGEVNPDNAFDNYPLTNSIVSSSQYRNVEGEDAVIGDFDTWVEDKSGGATGHKDKIQDSGGNDVYTILKRSGSLSIALRMD